MDAFHHFSRTVEDYDTVADSVVMKNEEIHGVIFNQLCKAPPKRVLDLGCGTGEILSLALERFPELEVLGIDFSPRMVQAAQSRLEPYKERVRIIEGDFRYECFAPRAFDAVVSSIAIHNIPHEDKKELFGKIAACLVPGGKFINGDFFCGETEFLDAEIHRIYVEHVIRNLSGDERKVWLSHIETDMPMRLSEQYQLLLEAGFHSVHTLWMYNNEAVYCATF